MSLGTWQNPFGPGALNNLVWFEIPDAATLSCGSEGSRCSFTREDFEQVDDDGGAIADQLEGAVWSTTANFANDVVNLRNCLFDTCIAACFNDCECKLPDNSPCTQTTPPPTPPPSPKPTNAPEEQKNCAMVENANLCSTVAVEANLKAGQECEYCYNFCNGKFLGCCERDGSCSQNSCEADEGGNLEKVFGCPEIIRSNGSSPTPPTPTPPTTGGSSAVSSSLSSALVVSAALVFLARELN